MEVEVKHARHLSGRWSVQQPSHESFEPDTDSYGTEIGASRGGTANQSPKVYSPFFAHQKKRIFLFFSCGATPSGTVPKTQPLEVASSLQDREDLRFQEDRIWGKKIAWERVGWTGQKKEKGCAKKGESMQYRTFMLR